MMDEKYGPKKDLELRYSMHSKVRSLQKISEIITKFENLRNPQDRYGCLQALRTFGLTPRQAERAIDITVQSGITPCGEYWFLNDYRTMA